MIKDAPIESGNATSSSSVVLDNVDDYLAPSQACINPLFQPPTTKIDDERTAKKATKIVPRRRRRRIPVSVEAASSANIDTGSKIVASSKGPRERNPTSEKTKKESAVKASIADCLACSGCVTTAETVLLEQRHSLKSLRQKLKASRGISRAVTISPNSWADMCRHWDLPPSHQRRARLRFTTLLHRILNVDIVIDGNLPLQWTWSDEAREFVDLYRKRNEMNIGTGSNECEEKKSPPLPSTAVDATKTTYYHRDGTAKTVENGNDDNYNTALPLISGSCPALVCLIEKSRSNLVPNLSQTQSPMTMMGSVLKSAKEQHAALQNPQNVVRTDLWDHWAIMPCHDKKLEASRQDFVLPNPKRSFVDLVITTSECVELVEEWIHSKPSSGGLQNEKWTVKSFLEDLPLADEIAIHHSDDFPTKTPTKLTFVTIPVSQVMSNITNNADDLKCKRALPSPFSSGGHANFIFSRAARELFGCSLDRVEWKAASTVRREGDGLNDGRKRVVKSARLARAQKQHYFKAQLFRHENGSYSQTAPNSSSFPLMEFSIAHGMQNMQRALKELEDLDSDSRAVRRQSESKAANDNFRTVRYLEGMACPHGGCINGGGAIPTRRGRNQSVAVRETPAEMRERIHDSLQALEVPSTPESWSARPCRPGAESWSRRTRYHVVPQMQHTLGATAGVKVEDIQW